MKARWFDIVLAFVMAAIMALALSVIFLRMVERWS